MLALRWDGAAAGVSGVEEPRAENERDAIVSVSLAGICNTDLEIVRGYMGFRGTLGHELVGRVVEGPAAWTGRRPPVSG